MAVDYSRDKGGFRFNLGGLNTRTNPDAIPPNKYPVVINVRAVGDQSVQTRDGHTPLFSTENVAITDIGAYATINTDDKPRFLTRNIEDHIFLDDGQQVGSLTGDASDGAFFIPFRPAQSPNSWMYVGNDLDYQKFSSPDAANSVTQYNVGLVEPQAPPDVCPDFFEFNDVTGSAVDYVALGVAGSPTDGARASATVVARFTDPASISGRPRDSIQLDDYSDFTVGQTVNFNSGSFSAVILDVIPPISPAADLTIQSIFYYAGTTGRCVIVPTQNPIGSSVPGASGTGGGSVFVDPALASLRRGAVVTLSTGPETVLVLSVSVSPSGLLCFECSTTGTHAAGETILGQPVIVVCSNLDNTIIGTQVASEIVQSVFSGAGTGALSRILVTSPFADVLALAPEGQTAQQEDYIHVSVNVNDLTLLVQGTITFDVGTGSLDYTTEAYYYQFSVLDFLGTLPTSFTIYPNNPWLDIRIPVSGLTRLGTNASKTLLNARGVKVEMQVTGSVNMTFGSISVGGGGQPDVGDSGAPYQYAIVPRSSVTGVRGNPSPVTRYGVSPLRQLVQVTLPTTYPDPQMDTWDVFRYGGTVTSYRYIGSAPILAGVFDDNFFDTSALGGSAIEYDNFQPWPSIALPFNFTPGTAAGITYTSQVVGTSLVVMASSASAFPSPFPATILRWLPGTLIVIGGNQAFTFWNRPVAFAPSSPPAHYYAYLINLVECAGSGGSLGTPGTGFSLSILEPALARQSLPYLFGPDAYGTLFGCGDPLRPGSFYFAKAYVPDSAPDTNNREVTDPSEPLLGGEILDGVAFVGSPSRWWALYFQAGNIAQPYLPVEKPIGRGLASPWGHCTDGKALYFWGEDGIYTSAGGPAASLTLDDLYNLFPHDGVKGQNVTYGPYTFYAPDYGRANTFRLAYVNGFLYADYEDSTATNRTLVLDLKRGAWAADEYETSIRVHFSPRTQTGPVVDIGPVYPTLVMADGTGEVYVQAPDVNDNGAVIQATIGTFEFDGGDIRASQQWGDVSLDTTPASQGAAMTVQPMAGGASVGALTTVPKSTSREMEVISLGGGTLQQYLGLLIHWEDDFTKQSSPTILYSWQPSFIDKPETIQDRYSDFDDAGYVGAKFVQGFILEADTFNVLKQLGVSNGDNQVLQQVFPTQHNGQSQKAYSLTSPFIAHMMRLEPQDKVPWRLFQVKWVFQPTPEEALNWITQATSHGLKGYMHVREVRLAFSSSANMDVVITSYDGQSPAPITVPSSAGAYSKVVLVPTFNKGILYTYKITSLSPFQLFENDCEVLVGQWDRQGPYLNYPLVGSTLGDQAKI